ncbi:MAG: squalene/phytoene synthase family protein [Neisseria sp.]|nr:squalene/phytoene synthase family protein [Neisseria sp.]
MQPLEYCREQAAAGRGAFAAVYRILPGQKRDALMVLDVFCSELARLPSECSDMQVAQAALEWRRQDLAKAFNGGVPETPVHQAVAEIARHFSLPQQEFADIIDGTETDMRQMRYTDAAWLEQYCRRVSGSAWRLAARIAGFSDERSLQSAEENGTAARLAQIVRDVGKDARVGRIYLPMNEMQRFNVPAADILHGKATPELAALLDAQIARAETHLRRAAELLPDKDRSAQKPLSAAAALVYALLQEIRRDGVLNVLNYTLAIPAPRQARIVWKTRLFGFKL